MEYKILLTDLDGTLLNDKKEISDGNKKAIFEALKKGFKVMICSGRSFMSLEKFIKELGLDKSGNYGVAYNGSLFYETDTNKMIIEYQLDKNLAFEIIEFCRSFDVDIMVYMRDKFLFEKRTERIEEYCMITGNNPNFTSDFKRDIKDNVSKVLVKSELNNLKRLEEAFKNSNVFGKVTTFYSNSDLYEFNPLGIDKGRILIDIAKHFNIDRKEIIAVGDNYNDVNMIKQAGLGIAVKNAAEDIRNAADYVTEVTNNESAIAEILNKFVLNK